MRSPDYLNGYALAASALARGCSPDWELSLNNYRLQPDFALGWNARMRFRRRVLATVTAVCYIASAAATLFVLWLAYVMWVS